MKKEDKYYELNKEEKNDLIIKLLGIKGKLYEVRNESDLLNNIIICSELKNRLMETDNEILIDFIYLFLKDESNIPFLFYLIKEKNEYEKDNNNEILENIKLFYDNRIKKEIEYLYNDINELKNIKILDKKFFIEKEMFNNQYDFTKLITGYNLINNLGYKEAKNKYYEVYEKCDALEKILFFANEYEKSEKEYKKFSNNLNKLKESKKLEKLNNLKACINIAEKNIVNTNNSKSKLKLLKKYIEGYRDEFTNNNLDIYENIKDSFNIESISQIDELISKMSDKLVEYSIYYLNLTNNYENKYKEVNEFCINNLDVNLDNIDNNIINYFNEIENELLNNKKIKKDNFLNASKLIYENDDINIDIIKKDYKECLELESYYYTVYEYEYYVNKSINVNRVIQKAIKTIDNNENKTNFVANKKNNIENVYEEVKKYYDEKDKGLKLLYNKNIKNVKIQDSNDEDSNN